MRGLLVALAVLLLAPRVASAQELDAGTTPSAPHAADAKTAPPELLRARDGQSRYVYIAAIGGLLVGGIIAYRQKKRV